MSSKWRRKMARKAQRLQLLTEPQQFLIATPMQDTCLGLYTKSLVGCIAHSLGAGLSIAYQIAQYSMLPISRNMLVMKAIEYGCTHILFIDSDMEFPPDLIVRLARHRLPIVAINCMARRHPYYLTARTEAKEEIATTRDSTGVEKVARVGTGIMMIHLDIFREMPQPWFEYRWIGGDKQHFQGEDYTFCDKAREAGHEIYIDHDLSKEVAHVGTFQFTPLMRAGFQEVQQIAEAEQSRRPEEAIANVG